MERDRREKMVDSYLIWAMIRHNRHRCPYLDHQRQLFCQFKLRQGTMDLGSIVRIDTVLISPFFLKVWTVITGLTHNDYLLLRLKKLVCSRCGKPSNLPSHTSSTYCHYFHNQLMLPQELKFFLKLFNLILILLLPFSCTNHTLLYPYV